MRKIASLMVLLLLGVMAFAQQTKTISGQVKDEKGEAVGFANVTEIGTKKTQVADANGIFKITIASGAGIEISAAGFETVKVVNPEGYQAISLKSTGTGTEVIVTTALGIKRQPKALGYSTANVNSEQITSGKSFNLAQALTNKVSGLTVYNTSASVNSSPRIVLRGLRSISGDNTALIVLDGVPVPSNTINYLNPNDIENISVMKGGQAATLFGSDGVNGAIVITTKKGSRKPEINVSHTSNAEMLSFQAKFQDEFGSGSAYGANRAEDFTLQKTNSMVLHSMVL